VRTQKKGCSRFDPAKKEGKEKKKKEGNTHAVACALPPAGPVGRGRKRDVRGGFGRCEQILNPPVPAPVPVPAPAAPAAVARGARRRRTRRRRAKTGRQLPLARRRRDAGTLAACGGIRATPAPRLRRVFEIAAGGRHVAARPLLAPLAWPPPCPPPLWGRLCPPLTLAPTQARQSRARSGGCHRGSTRSAFTWRVGNRG